VRGGREDIASTRRVPRGLGHDVQVSGVAGFSTSERTTLDLENIKMGGGTGATFSGNANGDVLTVTDGRGGIDVIAEASEGVATPHAFVSAMAPLGAMAGHVAPGEAWAARAPFLTSPRVAIA
jgi:hypothetical protein